jgi:hypothetical protein
MRPTPQKTGASRPSNRPSKKILKPWIVLSNQQPPRVHDLADLALVAGQPLDATLMELQVLAVEARYGEGPFLLPADRLTILAANEALLERCEQSIAYTTGR